MEEISTSFCFICLLHLANEQGLKLQTSPSLEAVAEDIDSQDKDRVGDIWSLKVRPLLSSLNYN
jgi:condensin complex subunit 2